MPSELGRLIRSRRRELGIGLREFARGIEKSPSFVATLEKGAQPPSASEETLRRMAASLNLNADTLIRLAGKTPADVVPRSDTEIALYRQVKKLDELEQEQLLKDLKKREGGDSL